MRSPLYLFIYLKFGICRGHALLFRLSCTLCPIPAVPSYLLFVVLFCLFSEKKEIRLKTQRNFKAKKEIAEICMHLQL